MKSKIKFISIILFLSALMMLISCQKQKAEWKGTIEEVDGVMTVKNPREPYYGELVLDLEEDLIIGREDNDNFLFFRVRDVTLDSENNIYILDSGNYRIQKFDTKGIYIKTIGKKGQGPGEFENPLSLHFDKKENLYVLDGRQIKIFSTLGEFKKSIPLETSIVDFSVNTEGDFLARINPSQERKEAIVRIDTEGKITKHIAEYSDVEPAVRKGSRPGSYIIFTAFHSYTPHVCFSPIDGESIAYGFPLKYEFYLADNEGNLRLRIQKDETTFPINEKEKNKIIKDLEKSISARGRKWPKGVLEDACKFPTHRPFFKKILIDEKIRLYLVRVVSVFEEADKVIIDVFDKDGYYLYKIQTPINPEIIRAGYLYELFSSEDTGEEEIRRYKINNWYQIKKGK
jgi:hypothetical protein